MSGLSNPASLCFYPLKCILFRAYYEDANKTYKLLRAKNMVLRAQNKDSKYGFFKYMDFKYGRSLWSCDRSLIYDKKNIRILMFKDSEKNIKVDKCLIRINSNTKTQMIDTVLNLDTCKFYQF